MSIRRTMLAAAIAAFAFALMPALASATSVDFPGAKTHFTVDSEEPVTIVGGPPEELTEISCGSATGTGDFENSTAGTIQLTFHGCFWGFVKCNSVGQSTGTITTTTLPFHLDTVNGKPGILITPSAGSTEHFATFKCSFLATIEIEGNGIIGTITKPGCNEESKEATIKFSQTAGVQDHLKTNTSETQFDLKTTVNGGKQLTAALQGEDTVTFEEEVTLTCR